MPETFTTRQLAVIAATNKTVYWLFRVIDILGNEYYWSTSTVTVGSRAQINRYAKEAANVYVGYEWEREHTFKITNFSGISLRRNKSESGIHAPNDVSFTIANSSNTLTASSFRGGDVRITLVVADSTDKQIVGSWRFTIKSASPYNQQIDVVCEDFLQQYLIGSYPNTRLVSEIFPYVDPSDNSIRTNCVPEPYGTCYIPLQSVYAVDGRYYFLGDTTNTYTITECRSPRSLGPKITWALTPSTALQYTKADSSSNNWRVFQAIIADSDLDDIADSNGLWLNGSQFLDMPVEFTRSDTVTKTNPADIIRTVLLNMGLLDVDLNGPSFTTAKATFTSWGLSWNFAFWYKEDRAKVLSKLLAMCHSCLIVGEQVSLQVLSKVSQKTITDAEVIKSNDSSPSSFKYTETLAERASDSGYVAFQTLTESHDLFQRALVPADLWTLHIDSEVLELPGVHDADNKFVQKLGTLYYQRKFLKMAGISAQLKGTCLTLRPDDIVEINYSDFGGNYHALIDELTIAEDVSVSIKAIRFNTDNALDALDDWGDLAPSAITIPSNTVTGSYSPVIAGPESPDGSNLPNVLPGRLRIGATGSYILLEPASPLRISLYQSSTEVTRLGNLNGFLGYVTNLYGIAIGDLTNYLKFDTTNFLRISGSITALTGYLGGTGGWVIATGKIKSASVTGTEDGSTYTTTGMVLGSTGYIAAPKFRVDTNGVLYAVDAVISGAISASTIDIGGADASSFHVDVDGNMWLGAATFDIATNPFAVSKAGLLYATGATIVGDYKTSATVGAGTPGQKGVHLSVANNELYFYGDPTGAATSNVLLASIGMRPAGPDYYIFEVGTTSSTRISIYTTAKNNYALCAKGVRTATASNVESVSTGVTVVFPSAGPTIAEVVGHGIDSSIVSDTDAYGTITTFTNLENYTSSSQTGTTYSNATAFNAYRSRQVFGDDSLAINTYRELYLQGCSYNDVVHSITNYYSIYQEDPAAKNFWAGYQLAKGGIRVGTTDTDPGDNNLYVEGTCDIVGISTFTGLIKTAGGLHVGGTSDPGADNLLVDGTSTLTGNVTCPTLTASLPVFSDGSKILVSKSVANTNTALGLGTGDGPTFDHLHITNSIIAGTTIYAQTFSTDYAGLTQALSINGTTITAAGSDSNVNITLTPKGTGVVISNSSLRPVSDNTKDLGSASYRWANIYTADLHLKNDKGDWTLQEDYDQIYLLNNKTGKRYSISMTEILD